MLNYLDLGNGDKTLILLHGLGQHHKAWENQLKLSDTYRLIIPDLRGHGDSPKDNITLKNMTTDVIELIEHLQLKQVYLGGLSLGGIIAQEVYKQRPDLITGLILSNTTFFIPAFVGNKIIRESAKVFEEDKGKMLDMVLERSLHNKQYIDEAKKSFNIQDCYLESAEAPVGINYTYTLMSVKCPTLIIGSVHDKVTAFCVSVLAKCLIPGSKLVTLNSGHLSNIECKGEWNEAVREFIS